MRTGKRPSATRVIGSVQDAAGLFSRWSQENFFGDMMEHFAIDLLNEYRTEQIPENNQPRPKAEVLGRPPKGAIYVR